MKMNRNVNKYIKDCKHFFPFLSKNEKIFLIENDRISSNKGDGKYV